MLWVQNNFLRGHNEFFMEDYLVFHFQTVLFRIPHPQTPIEPHNPPSTRPSPHNLEYSLSAPLTRRDFHSTAPNPDRALYSRVPHPLVNQASLVLNSSKLAQASSDSQCNALVARKFKLCWSLRVFIGGWRVMVWLELADAEGRM